jgi:hypothetical protein
MPNSVFVGKDQIIEQVYTGRQTFETVTRTAAEVMVLSDNLRIKKQKVRILVNLRGITKVTADALLAASDALNTILPSKIAVHGGNKYLNDLTNLVIAAVGRERSVMVFDIKKEALKWLKSKR